MHKKHVFITGAAGFIGGYAVREFVAQGWHVLALVHRRDSAELEQLAAAGAATIVRGDVTRPAELRAALAGALHERRVTLEAIVHCAGRASDVGWRSEFRRANFEAVQHLVQLAKEFDAARFVFISTTDVYGLRDFNGETEDELPLRAALNNPHPAFKIAAENWIRAQLPAARYAIVRPAAVWGAGDPTLTPRIVSFLRRSPWILHFGKWRGRNRWPLAHVRNVATAIYLAATLPEAAGGAINVLDAERTVLDEFYRLIASIYLPQKHLRSLTLPLWLGQVFGGTVSAISNLLNLDHPFADPSLYALYSVSSNLDFSDQRFEQLLARAGRGRFARDAGVQELRAFAEGRAVRGTPAASVGR